MPDDQSCKCDQIEFRFLADSAQVRQVLRRSVARFARKISQDDAGALELTLAEVLNNVVEHAYADLPQGEIILFLRREEASLACVVEDRGHPMPDLALPDIQAPEINENTADLPEGGWGWSLIRALTADLQYERRENVNRLTFSLPLSKMPYPVQ